MTFGIAHGEKARAEFGEHQGRAAIRLRLIFRELLQCRGATEIELSVNVANEADIIRTSNRAGCGWSERETGRVRP